ncbi:MAG: ribonuclease III family protein [Candidatus Bathyarchaeia archaeon]|jgi:hypothetical protein
MNNPDAIRQILRDKQLASLGDALVNLIYSLALTKVSGSPHGIKVSDRILADALKLAGLRQYMGSRVTKEDMANAGEALLAEAYRRNVLTIEEGVKVLAANPDGPFGGLLELLKLAAQRVSDDA